MSLFRKPKRTINRRVFSSCEEDCDTYNGGVNKKVEKSQLENSKKNTFCCKKSERRDVPNDKEYNLLKSKPLLSFADDDEENEVFQVRKSSYSKKMMRMMDKERRKKKEKYDKTIEQVSKNDELHFSDTTNSPERTKSYKDSTASRSMLPSEKRNKKESKIQTEIHTDEFVLVVKKSDSGVILNEKGVLFSGNDGNDNGLDNENVKTNLIEKNSKNSSIFSKPENLKQMLESGSIPNAAMIHAVRKRRQKARELGDFISIDDLKDSPKKGKRLNREGMEMENSDEEERVDMNAISGIKELEERREQFYSVENCYSEVDSECETNEWENQQIRKGVTGSQLVTAQQETFLSRFLIKTSGSEKMSMSSQSTSVLLDEAYSTNSFKKPSDFISSKSNKENQVLTLRTPQEITDCIKMRLIKLKELNGKHKENILKILSDITKFKTEEMDYAQKAPTAAAKYRFYQEMNGYISNLMECLNKKIPKIAELEKRAQNILSKQPNYLIERRRQDIRDQVREMTETSGKCVGAVVKKGYVYEQIVTRTAERECRRTRRRCDREKSGMSNSHLDGMSSDDEVSERFLKQDKSELDQLGVEVDSLFADTSDEFCKAELILSKFSIWRKTDMESYKNAYVSMCLPKILAPIIRTEILVWNPLNEAYNKDIETMNWYTACMVYGWSQNETDVSLLFDPDLKLVPTIIEKILLPKISEIITNLWDPMSTTQNLRIIGLINRFGRDYLLRESSSPLQQLFKSILDKMKSSLDNDVFIPIFSKQVQEARTSFFQRQFCSALKLFRNFLSWQGIIAEDPLRNLAILSLLNRYLLLAMRVCSINDALSKAYIVVNTLPSAWLQYESETLNSLDPLLIFIKSIYANFDSKNPLHMQSCDKIKQILQRLHSC